MLCRRNADTFQDAKCHQTLIEAANNLVKSIKFTFTAPIRANFSHISNKLSRLKLLGNLKSAFHERIQSRYHDALQYPRLFYRYTSLLHLSQGFPPRILGPLSLALQLNIAQTRHRVELIRGLVHGPTHCQRSMILQYDCSFPPIETLCRSDTL